MKRHIERLLSRVGRGDTEKSETLIRKSYPLFCASASDGIIIAALNPPGMPSRVDAILDRIAYGGIGDDADITVIVRNVGVPAIWKAEVEASHEDVCAEHLAQDAKELVAGGRKGSFLADPLNAEIVFAELGLSQENDRIIAVDINGRQYNKQGWAILPKYLSPIRTANLRMEWAASFHYNPALTMKQIFSVFEELGKTWRSLRSKSKEELVWEVAYLRRNMAQEKRWYEVFQKQPPESLKGGVV